MFVLCAAGVLGSASIAAWSPSAAASSSGVATTVPGSRAESAPKAEASPRERAESLIATLGEVDASALGELERKLADIGREAMVPLKLAELSGDLEVRRRAGAMARRLRWRLAVSEGLLEEEPELIGVMAGEDRQARTALVDRLVSSAAAPHVGFFVECLADPEPYVRQRAVQGLAAVAQRGGVAGRQARERLVALLGSAGDEQMRLALLGVLHELDHWPLDKIEPLLSEGTIEVRRTALLTMGHSRMPAAIEPVARQLEDPDWRIRAAALDALSDIAGHPDPTHKKRVADKVLAVVDDKDDFVRSRAMKLLVQLESPEAGEVLLDRLDRGAIDHDEALPLLARLQHPRAWPMLKERFDAAATDARRNEALAMMRPIAEDRRVRQLVADLLADERRRGLWLTAIELAASGRGHDEPLLPLLGDKLLAERDEIAQAAWSELRWRVSREPLPPELARKLEDAESPTRRRWLLLARARHANADAMSTAMRLVADPADEVAALAVSMVSQELGYASLGEEDLDRYRYHPTRPGEATHRSSHTEPEALREKLRALVRDADRPLAAARAAALLRLHDGSSEAVDAALLAALRADDADRRVAALSGLARSPGDLLDGVDVDALLADPKTRSYAAAALAARGREGDLAKVAAVLEGMRDVDHAAPILPALVAAGGEASDAAFAFIKSQGNQWSRSSALQTLEGVKGPEVVAFVQRVLEAGLIEDPYYQEASTVAMSLPHPDAAELLQWIMDNAPERAWLDRSGMMRRLISLDAEGSGGLLVSQLRRGDPESVEVAREALSGIEPTPAMIDAIVDAATTEPKLSGPAADAAVMWLPAQAIRERLLPAFERLEREAALSVLDRVASLATTDDVPTLLRLDDSDPGIRGRTAAIVGRLLRDTELNPPPPIPQNSEAWCCWPRRSGPRRASSRSRISRPITLRRGAGRSRRCRSGWPRVGRERSIR